MFVITTIGTNNATKTVLPFITAKGAMGRGETVSIFTMQEATRLGTKPQSQLDEITAPGLPPVGAILDELLAGDALEEFVVCEPCAAARDIGEEDLVEWASLGDATDLARLAAEHETTVSF